MNRTHLRRSVLALVGNADLAIDVVLRLLDPRPMISMGFIEPTHIGHGSLYFTLLLWICRWKALYEKPIVRGQTFKHRM